MRVGLNATCLNERPSGARQRFLGIYRSLAQHLPEAHFTVYAPVDWNPRDDLYGLENVEVVGTPLPSEGRLKRFAKGAAYWRRQLSVDRQHIFENFHQPMVGNSNGLSILTVHDMRAATIGENGLETLLYAGALRHDMARADHIISVSDYMKSEIEARFPRQSVSRIYNGVDVQSFRTISPEEAERFRREYGLPSGYLLSVGHLEKRKNYPNLLKAISLLKQRGLPVFLVIIGNDSGDRHTLQSLIYSLNLANEVTLLSHLTDRELKCAYKGAELLVFPSAYEGFGIPVLEAMASDTPLALSDIAVFRELTQNSVIYFPHDDIEAMADAIERGMSSSDLRDQMVDYGRQRVADFDFRELGAELSRLYRRWL